MLPLTEILERVKGYHPQADLERIHRAYAYSARMHDGQKRKSGEPYFVHPVGVAGVIAEMRLDDASICAALLHDVVEDTLATPKDIEGSFGKEVAFLVEGVTKLGKVNFSSKEDRQAESFRKMLVAMARDIRVLLVKLADRLDNMRTLDHMSLESRERIARETLEIYAPLAGRLGIQWLKDELEDLCFLHLYPEAHAEVSGKVRRAAKDSDRYIRDVTRQLERMLVERNFAVEVTGRFKQPFSIYRKMRQNNCEFEQIHDLLAFRVVMENVSDCYGALGVTHAQWTPIPGRFKDYIALPKSNMYQSLHTTVIGPEHRRIEVQIRTKEMHRIAELGIAAHWNYKEGAVRLDPKDAAKFTWLRQLMEFQQEVKDPDEFIDGVKVDLFNDEVYVFTPKGDVRVFPRGATPIDFAYSIHTEVGDHAAGARINGSIVPLSYKLHNGDTIEILTASRARPSKDWLSFVATAKARSRVRGLIRGEERQRSLKLGRELLERELHKKNLSFARCLKSGELARASQKLRLGTVDDMYVQIGYGKLSLQHAVEQLCPSTESTDPSLRPSLLEKTVRKVTRPNDKDGIVISGMNDVLVRFAKCCNPLPGDAITGWITRGRGVSVHRKGCPRALALDPARRVDISWSGHPRVDLPVMLRVVTADRPGILANISRTFNDGGVNITEANCRSLTDGRAVNTFQFAVGDVSKLRLLMRNLSRIKGVYEVERV